VRQQHHAAGCAFTQLVEVDALQEAPGLGLHGVTRHVRVQRHRIKAHERVAADLVDVVGLPERKLEALEILDPQVPPERRVVVAHQVERLQRQEAGESPEEATHVLVPVRVGRPARAFVQLVAQHERHVGAVHVHGGPRRCAHLPVHPEPLHPGATPLAQEMHIRHDQDLERARVLCVVLELLLAAPGLQVEDSRLAQQQRRRDQDELPPRHLNCVSCHE